VADLRRKLTIEEALDAITDVVSTAEDSFNARYGRRPSLDQRDDLIDLADFLDAYGFMTSTEYKAEDNLTDQGIMDVDIAYVLLRKYLEREGFFNDLGINQSKVFDGFMGRLSYNPDPREYQFRLDALNEVRERISFPSDFPSFKQKLLDIDGVARKLGDEGEENKARTHIGMQLCHVISSLYCLAKGNDFDTFTHYFESVLASKDARSKGRGDQYT